MFSLCGISAEFLYIYKKKIRKVQTFYKFLNKKKCYLKYFETYFVLKDNVLGAWTIRIMLIKNIFFVMIL